MALIGTLRGVPNLDSGSIVTIRIDKIKLKDPSQFIEPFFTVSLKGPSYVC
jgi:hypothetical protein